MKHAPKHDWWWIVATLDDPSSNGSLPLHKLLTTSRHRLLSCWPWWGKEVKGWASSLINEDANKRLKERVLRESPSQLIKSVRLWLELIDSALLSTYKETDVTIDTCAQPPDNEDFERIFRRTSTNVAKCTIAENLENERIKKWHAEIQKIKTVKFHTFNPGSEPELYAEMVLMRICTANDNWISVPDAWRSGLLPEGCLVERIASEENSLWENDAKLQLHCGQQSNCRWVCTQRNAPITLSFGQSCSSLKSGAYIQHATFLPYFSPRITFSPPSLVS